MRLTLVNQFYAPDLSPTAQLAASLAESRARRGDLVTVVAGTGRYAARPDAGRGDGIPNLRVRRLWTPALGKATALRRLAGYAVFFSQAAWTLLTLPSQDAIVLMTTPPFLALAGIAHRLRHRRVRLIVWSMDCYPEAMERAGMIRERGLISGVLRALNRWLFRRIDSVVCLDDAMRLMLERAYAPGGRPRLLVIPNWEPAARFPAGGQPRTWAGTPRLGLQGKQVVLYLGNAGAGHRFDTILQAARRLPTTDHAFLFIGGGSAWPELTTARDAGGGANLTLEAYVSEDVLPAVLASADAALIVLRDEMLGVMSPSKLHSALAMSLPIVYIGPPGGNVHEAIERFGCGVSLRHGDVESVVEFLSRLRIDAAARQEYARRSRQAFEAAYTDQVGLARFDALLDGGEAPR
jgi:glycosyltransferase involved in cell wall biosynthesis